MNINIHLKYKPIKNSPCCFLLLLPLLFLSWTPVDSVDFIIKNVKVFDGNIVMEHMDVYVKDGVVKKMGATGNAAAVNYKYLVDGKGKTLIPGLINAHVHLSNSSYLKESAQAGVLTMLELLRLEEDSIDLYKNLGETPQYSYFYTSGIGADMPNAVFKHFQFFGGDANKYAPQSKDGVADFISGRVKNKVDFIKIFQDSRLPEKFSDSLFEQLIAESHKYGLVTTIHQQTLRDAEYSFDKGADVLAHLWGDYSISQNTLEKWRSREFYITPTLLVHLAALEQFHPKSVLFSRENFLFEIQKLYKAGLHLLAGTDAPNLNINHGTDLYKELYLFVEAGLTPVDALKTATSIPANAYRLKDKGIIRENSSADFVLVNGNVLKDIHQLEKVVKVWKKGVMIKGEL